MRGGAIPLLVWGTVLAVLLAMNWVWTGDLIQVASFAFAVASVVGWVLALVLLRPGEALRRGSPGRSGEPQAVPSASYGSVLLAVGASSIVFGFAFGTFPLYFGAGVMVIAAGLVARELHAERRARKHWRERGSGDRP